MCSYYVLLRISIICFYYGFIYVSVTSLLFYFVFCYILLVLCIIIVSCYSIMYFIIPLNYVCKIVARILKLNFNFDFESEF